MNALDVMYATGAVALAPWWMRKARGGWPERFGKTPDLPAKSSGKPRLMLHAVSVGEVSALRTLVPLLTQEHEVVISATTDTGLARAAELFGSVATIVRYPLDFSKSVRRFLDAVQPDAVALVELELWPNFVAECSRRSIPIGVINGRLSERSFRGYRKIRRVMRPAFAALEFAAVQDEDYAKRFEFMGVRPGRCRVTGSMKWDAAKIEDVVPGADDLAGSLGIDRGKPLIVAGSTGPGEEELLHTSCPAGVQLLCAPRKPERFDEAAAAMPGCVRRSATKGSDRSPIGAERFLLDSIGELRMAYSVADVVVVGRSFGTLYGSDPVEPVALGKPTVIGPAYGDFQQAVGALSDGDGIVIAGHDRIGPVLRELVESPRRRVELGTNGRRCIREHQGASERHAELLRRVVHRHAV